MFFRGLWWLGDSEAVGCGRGPSTLPPRHPSPPCAAPCMEQALLEEAAVTAQPVRRPTSGGGTGFREVDTSPKAARLVAAERRKPE